VAGLFGRDAELELLDARLRSALAGQGSIVLVTGEPGIGKSALGRELAARAAGAGLRVASARCWEAGGAPSYWPWLQVFRALGVAPFDSSTSVEADDSRERRFQLFETAAGMLAQATLKHPTFVLLDDLHAADLPSLLLLKFLSRQVSQMPLALLGTARDAEVRLSPAVAEALAKIAREGDVLPLRRLSPSELAAWVAEQGGTIAADELFRATEGNPLFVQELLRVGPGRAGQLANPGIRAAIDEHLRLLPAPVHQLLRAASVLGRHFGSRELAGLAHERHDVVSASLNSAVDLCVLQELERDHYQFTHILLRDRLYAQLEPALRSDLHWRAGLLLERRGADAATVANQLLEGASAGPPLRAAESALAAARGMSSKLAFEAAAAMAERGLALLDGVASPLDCQLEIALGAAQIGAGLLAEGGSHCARAAERAEASGFVQEQALAALTYASEVAPMPAVDPVMVRLLESARSAVGSHDSRLAVRLTARLHAALIPPRNDEEAKRVCELGQGALAMARRLGDEATLLYALEWALQGISYMMPADERFDNTRQLVQLAEQLTERRTLVRFLASHTVSLLERGERGEAELALARFEELLASLADRRSSWRLPMLRAGFCFFDGDIAGAQKLGDEALELGERAGASPVYVHWALQRISLAIAREEPSSISKDAARVLAILTPSTWAAGRAWVLAAMGRRSEAQAALRLTQAGFPPLIVGAEACTLLQDREFASTLRRLLAERCGGAEFYWGSAGGHVFGPTSRTLGDLAILCDQPETARRDHAAAVALCRRIGAPALGARAARSLGSANAPSSEACAVSLPDPAIARPVPASPADPCLSLRREGDVWAVSSPWGREFRLKHTKGLWYLSELLGSPGREIHVLALVGFEHGAGDAGPVLDAHAKADYRSRLQRLSEEISEAEALSDASRVARAREELELLSEQFASAVGLGGRDRRAASDMERARINVQRRLKSAIGSIAVCDAELGRYLSAAIKTGTYCSFVPL